MITQEELNEWKRLAGEATPGPWYLYDGYINRLRAYCVRIGTSDFTVLSAAGRIADLEAAQIDFEFIAASREMVPALIAEVERLTQQVTQ